MPLKIPVKKLTLATNPAGEPYLNLDLGEVGVARLGPAQAQMWAPVFLRQVNGGQTQGPETVLHCYEQLQKFKDGGSTLVLFLDVDANATPTVRIDLVAGTASLPATFEFGV